MTLPAGQEAQEAVARDIVGLADLDRAELVARWQDLFGAPPPKSLSQALLCKAQAHDMQCRAFGGLTPVTRRALRQALEKGNPSAPNRTIAPGARLVREWHGRTHEVEVVENGFRWRDQTWTSLSRIAREITGSNWSGPRFFGLTGKR